VERQGQNAIWPVPVPLTKQQAIMLAPSGTKTFQKLQPPVVDMCCLPMLTQCIRGKLFEEASTIVGNDVFCNIAWLHFGKNSIIRERLPQVISNIWNFHLKESDVDQLICFHDECYAAYTHLAPAFGIEVPFKPIHLFDFLTRRLDELRDEIHPIKEKVVYQRPCSNRLISETEERVNQVFKMVGVVRIARKYERENALCCGLILRGQQRDELADDVQERNLDDMEASGAKYCVFNCPFCLFTLGESVSERGMTPILMSELCQMALGEEIMVVE
jgi:Fe-S oxidoreductase